MSDCEHLFCPYEGLSDSELLREVGLCGVEFDEPRIKYLSVQIDRCLWETLTAKERHDRRH